MKNLQSELQEHRVNAVEAHPRTVDQSQKGQQNATRYCIYCRTNRHTPSWCRKKIPDEELKRIETERTAERKVMFTQDYNRKRGLDHGSEQWARGHDFQRRNQNYNNDGFRRNSPPFVRVSLQGQILHMGTIVRTTEDHMINAQTSHSIETMGINLETDLLTTRRGTGETKEVFAVLDRFKEENFRKLTPIANKEVISLTALRSADLTINQRLVLRRMNKSFRRTIMRHHLMWFASPQSMIPLTNCRIFAR